MKVGNYVRTKWGIIGKISKIVDFEKKNKKPFLNYKNMLILTNDEGYDVIGSRGEIVKSSSNIIDLIEVGDYVNGQRINFIHKDIYDGEEWVADKGLENETTSQILLEEDIKSIVTKEQFEKMEYKVGVDKNE